MWQTYPGCLGAFLVGNHNTKNEVESAMFNDVLLGSIIVSQEEINTWREHLTQF